MADSIVCSFSSHHSIGCADDSIFVAIRISQSVCKAQKVFEAQFISFARHNALFQQESSQDIPCEYQETDAFRGAYSFVDKKYRKKFISKLDSNTMLYSKNIDLTVPQRDGDGSDSVSELAKSVEDFLATSPDRSLAKVVLKGLYSAKFSSAMSIQNKLRLKNVIDDLKNYVG